MESVKVDILPTYYLPLIGTHSFFRSLCQRWFYAKLEVENKLPCLIVDTINLMRGKTIENCGIYLIKDIAKYSIKHIEGGNGIINTEETNCAYRQYTNFSLSYYCLFKV